MNPLIRIQAPTGEITVAAMKSKTTREIEKLRNRENSHMLKSTLQHRPAFARSVPHARGR